MSPRPVLLALAAALLLATGGAAASRARHPQAPRPPAGLDPRLTAGWRTDFRKHAIPLGEIQPGGLGKDGIPALTSLHFTSVARADAFLQSHEPVVAVEVKGRVRAYPIEILIWHEIVNDTIAGVPVAVTYFPLANTAVVFDRRVGGQTLVFGTTGNLLNSDLLLYDLGSESWWEQLDGKALVGRYAGTRLRELPALIVGWRDFRRAHPDGLVLTRETGYNLAYGQNPYVGYDKVSSRPFYRVAHAGDRRLPPKERVVFVERGGQSVAVPFSSLARRRLVRVVVGGHRLVVRVTGKVASPLDTLGLAAGRDIISVEALENGRPVPFQEPFWFVVAAFEPHVKIVR